MRLFASDKGKLSHVMTCACDESEGLAGVPSARRQCLPLRRITFEYLFLELASHAFSECLFLVLASHAFSECLFLVIEAQAYFFKVNVL
jgi:hypothetical protein